MMRRLAILAARLWVVAALAGPVAAVRAEDGRDGLVLQPQALKWVGVHRLRQVDPGLIGSDVRLGVICLSYTYNEQNLPRNDYQPNLKHGCFQDVAFRFEDNGLAAPSVSPHATAICSILFGQDGQGAAPDLDPFLYQGVIPAADATVYELGHFVQTYINEGTAPPVDVVTASFGQSLEASWTRGLEALAEHEGLIVVASIGNGSKACDPTFYPGAGANAIGVGVVSSVNAGDPATQLAQFALAYPEDSSMGPTDDGRCKPDLIAPGNCLVAEAGGEQGYVMAGNWSSYAAPVAAGVVGLLVQAARQDSEVSLAASPEAGGLVLKSVLMSSAAKLPYWHKGLFGTHDDREAPLDRVQGAGMVDAARAYAVLKAGQGPPGDVAATGWDLNQVNITETYQQVYRFTVEEPTGKMLAGTLVWNRHYREDHPFQHMEDMDSDLRLEVWAVDPTDASRVRLLDWSDSKSDNVEHVYVELLADYTQYEIVVTYGSPGGKVATVAGERYGLAWTVQEKQPAEGILGHDLNADGVVNDQDIALLVDNWAAGLRSPEAYVIGDLNGDGKIDNQDMMALLEKRDDTADWYAAGAAN